MTLIEIAQVYVDLVTIENEIPEEESCGKDRVNMLRTKYHDLLMQKMREEGIPFSDRFDAMQQAFDLVKKLLFPLNLFK